MKRVHILGGGPAGCCAALSALNLGAAVEIADRTFRQRHKVCGEFFSPGIELVLERLGVWPAFAEAKPAAIRRIVLNFGRSASKAALPETAWGLSRFVFDRALIEAITARGASLVPKNTAAPGILATGRSPDNAPAKGERIFGWKAHFDGPQEDAIELYFFEGCYIGVNAVEGGRANVCGLGPERALRAHGFDIDSLIDAQPALRERFSRLRRSWDWLHVGPLIFQHRLRAECEVFPCGDALSFVDPFTGSGLLAAALTGELAGASAVRGIAPREYLVDCYAMLGRPFTMSSVLRRLVGSKLAEFAGSLAPAAMLFRMTRPQRA